MCQCSRGKISVSTWFQAIWELDPQVAGFKACKYMQSYGNIITDPAGLQNKQSGGVPSVTVVKREAPFWEGPANFLRGIARLRISSKMVSYVP